jgi:hypothetical protein
VRALKVLLWTVVLLACAGVGAFVASRSNPFPPGVGGSGAIDEPSPTGEPAVAWSLAIVAETRHEYLVGGSCVSDWRGRARIRVSGDGRVVGTGVARLRRGAGCEFQSAQVQTRRVTIRVTGDRLGRRLRLRFRTIASDPPGSRDLGGLEATLGTIRPVIRERADATATVGERVVDAAGEHHVARYRFRLTT